MTLPDFSRTIENRSKELLKFVNAYKDFSKTPELHLTETDLVALIDRICHLLEPDINKVSISLVKDFNIKKLNLRLDHELIEQVIINLIKNAIEVLEDHKDPLIKIHLQRAGAGKVNLAIQDNGTGITKEVMDNVFIPFYTTKKKGTGIGLSFSRQVMKLHGGNISVSSEPDKGTTFMLEF